MTGNNTLLLVITGGVASEFENLSGQVFKHSSEVHCKRRVRTPKSDAKVPLELTRCTCTNTLSVVALLQEPVDTTNRELETSLGRARLGLGVGACLSSGLASLSFARHCEWLVVVLVG